MSSGPGRAVDELTMKFLWVIAVHVLAKNRLVQQFRFIRILEIIVGNETALAATLAETAPVWELKGPLELSSRTRPFPGSIDELVLSAVVADEPAILPEGVTFVGDTPAELFFRAGGGLDRRRHPDPAVITLEFNDGTRTELVVGAYGTVQ